MSQLKKDIEQYFQSSLQRGEKRKILYLYDKESSYKEELFQLSKETEIFKLLEVHDHNYIYTNYLIEKEFVDDHLFLYFPNEKPHEEENPLLDVLLYSQELKMDEKSQLSSELGISVTSKEFSKLVELYQPFFNAKDRKARFSRIFSKGLIKDANDFEMSIYATLAKVNQPDWIDVFIRLFEETNLEKQPIWENIQKFSNESQFWYLVKKLFSYQNNQPNINNLLQQLFITHLADELGDNLPNELHKKSLEETNRALVFINQWMNQRDKHTSFAETSERLESVLDISRLFNHYPLKDLARAETFKWFDTYIIQSMAEALSRETPDLAFYESLVQKRRNTFWYPEYRNHYHLLKWAIRLTQFVYQYNQSVSAQSEELWQAYEKDLWQIDQAYRKFYFYYDQLEEIPDYIQQLQQWVEKRYLNKFVGAYAYIWDKQMENEPYKAQRQQNQFYERVISPLVAQDKKVFVIISDGLRLEAGQELFDRLTASGRFNGQIEGMQTLLPSYTALGMAALLPHQTLTIQKNGEVSVDAMKSVSTDQRNQILNNYHPDKSIAIQYETLMQKNRDELRATFSGKRLIYIYHNHIDAIGDQKKTEHRVFQAVEDSMQELQRLLTRLATEVSASQLFVTADHGFFYQRSQVEPYQKVKMAQESLGSIRNKRFVINTEKTDKLEGVSVTLENLGELKYLTLPRSTNRFTFSGGGYQYVHGGYLPQETMVPLLELKTLRSVKGTQQVSVTLLNQNRLITNDTVWLSFLQTEAVTTDQKEKRLSIYFEDNNGVPISNEVSLLASSTERQNENRIYERKFVILNRDFDDFESCYLVMKNVDDKRDIQREKFEIDIV